LAELLVMPAGLVSLIAAMVLILAVGVVLVQESVSRWLVVPLVSYLLHPSSLASVVQFAPVFLFLT
jgi:hypothetical protein